jgi:cation:H+ antiporter
MLDILLLIAGFVLLIYGANWLVDGASALAKRFNIPNIVIGLTIVAFGTSSPELVVNVFASVNQQSDIVLGNIVGSNIFNVLATLGVAAMVYPLTVKSNTTWIEIPLSLLSAVVLLVVANDVFLDGSATSVISRADGIVLLFFFVIFMVYNIRLLKNNRVESQIDIKKLSVPKTILFIVGGLGGLIIGGRLIVDSASELARAMGISERIIGLTIVSIGTSAPELATSVVAAMKKNVDIAIGNIVGSNIFNAFLILGVSAIIYPVSIHGNSNYDLLVNVGAGVLLFVFVLTGGKRKLESWKGLIFAILYVLYLLSLIFY